MMDNHETLEEAGYCHWKRIDSDSVLVWNHATDTAELWAKSPDYPGYAIVISGVSYEFIGSVPNQRWCDEHQAWESIAA